MRASERLHADVVNTGQTEFKFVTGGNEAGNPEYDKATKYTELKKIPLRKEKTEDPSFTFSALVEGNMLLFEKISDSPAKMGAAACASPRQGFRGVTS